MADMEKETTGTETSGNKKRPRRISAASRRKFKYGGIATAITCIVTVLVVVLNVLVGVIVEKYPVKVDLTEKAMFEISDQTIDYIKALEQDVNFTVLMDESNFQVGSSYLKMVSEILERYTQYSGKIHLSYVDPTKNPDVVNSYQEHYSASLQEGDVIISNASDASKMRVVNVDNMFSYDQEKYYYYRYYGGRFEDCVKSFTGEQDLTAALMYVTDADPVSVGFITSANGESIYNAQFYSTSIAVLSQTLTRNGYDIKAVDLYTDALDPDVYDMLVLPAPVNDLTQTAVDNISAFLYNNGNYERNLLYIADYTQSETPNLDALLESWGLRVTGQIAMEGDAKAAQQVTLSVGAVAVPVASIANTEYSSMVSNTALPIAAPLCRTVELLWDSKSSGITSPLLTTSDTVYLNEMGSSSENADKKPAGSQTIMAISKRNEAVNNVTVTSSLMVMGSVMLSDAVVMQDASYNNAEFFVSAVNTMNKKGDSLVIASKDLTNETISVSKAQVQTINFFLFGIPVAVAIIGVVVFVRRRNRWVQRKKTGQKKSAWIPSLPHLRRKKQKKTAVFPKM